MNRKRRGKQKKVGLGRKDNIWRKGIGKRVSVVVTEMHD